MESQRFSHVNTKCKILLLLLLLFSWSQTVGRATERYELHLKVLLTPTDPVNPFVQSYLLLLTDFNLDTFQKFLEIKGISPSKRAEFVEEFQRHAPPTPSQIDAVIPPVVTTATNITSEFINSAFDRLKSTLNVVNVIKRTYTRRN